jgi:hypothetical protein
MIKLSRLLSILLVKEANDEGYLLAFLLYA